jgi:zinc finger protein
MDYTGVLTGYDPQYIEPALADSCNPVMFTLKIVGESDLVTRVIKSKNACIEIPELDIRILPGLNSKDLICDVFGLLSRIEGAIEMGLSMGAEKSDELLEKIAQLKDGSRRATLVLTDPSGLSLILGGAAKEIINT